MNSSGLSSTKSDEFLPAFEATEVHDDLWIDACLSLITCTASTAKDPPSWVLSMNGADSRTARQSFLVLVICHLEHDMSPSV